MGAELIGVESIEADAADAGTGSRYSSLRQSVCVNSRSVWVMLTISQSLIEDAGLGEESEARVRELIGNRNFPGVEEYQDRHRSAS